MAKTYRAKCESYGFRGQVWAKGQIAEDVTADEEINEHFELVPQGEKAEAPNDPSFEPPEPTTLSEIQNNPPKPEPTQSRKSGKK